MPLGRTMSTQALGGKRMSREEAMQSLSPEDCIREAEAAKEAGNVLFRRGSNEEALAKYREGLELCSLYHRKVQLKAKSRELYQRAAVVVISLHLNAAQVCLKLWDWDSAASHADRVLQINPQNLKALYRRAVARSHTDSTLEQACEDFARVVALDPSNKEAQEGLQRTQELMRSFYDLLAVTSHATTSQIRQAYLREAKRWHPDKASSDDKELAEKRFKVIAEAHEVLKDDQLRQHYDLYLQWRQFGFMEFEDPEGLNGSSVRLPFNDWTDFRRLLEQTNGQDLQQELARRAGRRGRPEEAPADDPDDPPLSIGEWLLAGGVVLAIWCFSVWRHSHRRWLQAMPLEIWTVHEEYSLPLGLLMSPLFFGNVPFEEATRWLNSMVREAVVAP